MSLEIVINGEIMKKKILIAILSIIGIITTIKLALIYYNVNFTTTITSSFCSINEFIDCDSIAGTTESQFLGIPLAYWGMFLYCFILLMLFADKLKKISLFRFLEVFKNPMDYIATLGLISFVISMILLCVSLFEIGKLCILCVFTYILNLVIGCIAVKGREGMFVGAFKQSVRDFVDAIKIKKYLAAFVVVALLASGFLSYAFASAKFAPQLERKRELQEFSGKNKYAVKGNLLGDKNAKVVVYLYSDYQCPYCPVHNSMMHKLAKELKNVKIVHKNLPLDMSCNKRLSSPFHFGSCIDAQYAIAAEKQGKAWEMNDLLFEKKPKTEAEILKLIENKGYDVEKLKKDAHSPETMVQLHEEMDEAYDKYKINGTPATVVNGEARIGLKSYDNFKEWLQSAGAEKRKKLFK